MTALEGFWECQECGQRTDEPHTAPDGGDTCPECCVECTSGATFAAQEQFVLDHKTSLNPGDPATGHGCPTREQSAAAESAVAGRLAVEAG